MSDMDYFQMARVSAERFRFQVFNANAIVVRRTIEGGINGAFTVATFPRCEADVFEKGVLTITAKDDGFVLREYQPGEWIDATAYDANDHIQYHLSAEIIGRYETRQSA